MDDIMDTGDYSTPPSDNSADLNSMDIPALEALKRRLQGPRSRYETLAPLAATPMPQGQMVSGIFVPPNPLMLAASALQRGLGMKGAMDMQQRQDQDATDRYLYEQGLKEKTLGQTGDIARERMQTQQDIAGQRTQMQQDLGEQRLQLLEEIQKLREERMNQTEEQRRQHYDTQEELRRRDQELRQHEQDLRERGQNRAEGRGQKSLRLREAAEARQRAKLSGGERKRLLPQAAPAPAVPEPNVDDLLQKYGGQ